MPICGFPAPVPASVLVSVPNHRNVKLVDVVILAAVSGAECTPHSSVRRWHCAYHEQSRWRIDKLRYRHCRQPEHISMHVAAATCHVLTRSGGRSQRPRDATSQLAPVSAVVVVPQCPGRVALSHLTSGVSPGCGPHFGTAPSGGGRGLRLGSNPTAADVGSGATTTATDGGSGNMVRTSCTWNVRWPSPTSVCSCARSQR